MTPEIFHKVLLPATLALYPASYNTPPARAMLLAIAGVESEFLHRQQLVGSFRRWWESINGPAASYFQIERIGIRGVLEHRRAGPMLRDVLAELGYPPELEVIWMAIKYDIVLAVVVARLILWIDPEPLPGFGEPQKAYAYYLRTWRPGKPCSFEKWLIWYERAWSVVRTYT
jgi:hypothetical protein